MTLLNQIMENLCELDKSHELMLELKDKADFKELTFSKQKRNLERIKESILNTDIIEFDNDTNSLNRKMVEEVLLDILKSFFKEEELKEYFLKTIIDKEFLSSKYDSIEVRNRKTNTLENFLIGGYDYYTVIPNLAHEYTHSKIELQSQIETITFLGNYHYMELMSILMEQIVAKEAEEILNMPIKKAIDIIRIRHIKEIVEIKETLEKKLINTNTYKLLLEYQQHDTYKYLLGDIFATNLFEEYLKDKEKVSHYIKLILDHKAKIDDFLNEFNISLKERKTQEIYEKKLKRVSI